MKYTLVLVAFVMMALGAAGCAGEQYSQSQRGHSMKADSLRAMKMQDVIDLSKAGVSDSLIVGMMDATDTWFHLKTRDVINLRNEGVSEKVISAMMQPPPQASGTTNDSHAVRYYADPWFFWYDGFYPYWYYPPYSPRFSTHLGFRPYHPIHFHRGRFR